MMKTSKLSALAGAVLAGGLVIGLFAGHDSAKAGVKVEVCHFPPGNPANFHTIVVGVNAAVKHVQKHGDVLGPCCGIDNPCDDGDACTADFCLDGRCGSEPVGCSDGVACTDDFCDSVTGCVFIPNDANCARGEICDANDGCGFDSECVTNEDCEDGDLCNGDDFCFDGVCEHNAAVLCQLGTACQPETGLCTGTQGPCEVDADCQEAGFCRCVNGGCTPMIGGICGL